MRIKFFLIGFFCIAAAGLLSSAESTGYRAALSVDIEGYFKEGEYIHPEDQAESALKKVCAEAMRSCEELTGKKCAIFSRRSTFALSGYMTGPAEFYCWADVEEKIKREALWRRFVRRFLGFN